MKDLINIRLEEIRRENKLSRKDIEEISGFNHLTIGGYERGNRTPSKEYIEFISLYFGYKKEYIEGKSEDKFLDYSIKILLMYQKIFNYDDKKMANLLNISIQDYYNILKNCETTNELIVKFSSSLKISIPSFLNGRINESKMENSIVELIYEDIQGYKKSIVISFDIFKKYFNANDNIIAITPDYYASIIKQRNQPEIITPDTQKESIPDKYKEILELLPYASDSFTQNLKNKLLELKKAQQIEDL